MAHALNTKEATHKHWQIHKDGSQDVPHLKVVLGKQVASLAIYEEAFLCGQAGVGHALLYSFEFWLEFGHNRLASQRLDVKRK